MPKVDLIEKLKTANLTGRGGAAFPTWKKWQVVKGAKDEVKYVIANGSEGEPGVFKDGWLLENRLREVVKGLKLAMEAVNAYQGIIYLRHDYYDRFKDRLTALVVARSHRALSGRHKMPRLQKSDPEPISVLRKSDGYIGGEETSVIAGIEGRRIKPSLRPPFPTTCGLYGHPTLINNLETLYEAYLISENKYKNTRLYSISGDIPKPGVYELPEDIPAKDALVKTKNLPKRDFFVQIGGGASGEILNSEQLDKIVGGMAAIVVYDLAKTDLSKLLKGWIEFFACESCGQCVPCREGTYRLKEVFAKEPVDWGKAQDLLETLEKTSFCALGSSVPMPILSFFNNIKPTS